MAKNNQGRRRGKAYDFDEAMVLSAIKDSHGIMSVIAQRLKVNWMTAQKYCLMYESTKEALTCESEAVLDMCESTIIKAVESGDTSSARWVLASKGKKRGYSEKMEVEHSGQMGLVINIVDDDDTN
jgi:hypothetical protein